MEIARRLKRLLIASVNSLRFSSITSMIFYFLRLPSITGIVLFPSIPIESHPALVHFHPFRAITPRLLHVLLPGMLDTSP